MLLVQEKHLVPAVWPVDLTTGANPGDYVSLKNYGHNTVDIAIGAASHTCVVTLLQATSVAAAGAKALAFLKIWMTGVKLKINTKTGNFTAGEVVNGAGGGQGTVYKDNGDHLLLYTVNATAFVNAETVTGATSGITAKADGIGIDEDTLLPVVVASTFTIPAIANRKYVIEVDANTLDIANGYDCMRVHMAQAGGGSVLGNANYVLSEPRYITEPMPTAIYD